MRAAGLPVLAGCLLGTLASVCRAGPPPKVIDFDDYFTSGALGPPNWLPGETVNLSLSGEALAKTGTVALGRGKLNDQWIGSAQNTATDLEFTADDIRLNAPGVTRSVTLRAAWTEGADNWVVFGTIMAYRDQNDPVNPVKGRLILGRFKEGEVDLTDVDPDPPEEFEIADPSQPVSLVLSVRDGSADLSSPEFPAVSAQLGGVNIDAPITGLWIEIQGAYEGSTEGPLVGELHAHQTEP